MRPMKKFLLILLFLFSLNSFSQSLYFPPNFSNTWDTLSPASLGWCDEKIDSLYNYLDDRNSKAFILLKDGKIVLEKYFDNFTQDSIWYWASAGKSLTAFTVGIAQQEGYLSIDDTTSSYIGTGWTSAPLAKENLITIRHQLTMSSGLDDGVPDIYCTLPSCLQYLEDAGDRWAYHNAPYTLLDTVIESATGMNLNTYVTQKICLPTGMTGLFVQQGYNNVFVSKPRSMARFGLLALNKGNWNGTLVMTDTNYFNQMVNTSQSLNESYGYLWWLNGKSSFMVPSIQVVFPGSLNPNAPNDLFVAAGKNGQLINVVPSQKIVFIRMGENPLDGGSVTMPFNDTIWQYLNDIICNVSIEENDNNNHIQVYPNPISENTININSTSNILSIEFFDLRGSSVHFIDTEMLGSKTYSSSKLNLSSGVYILIVKTEKGMTRKKVVVNK